MDSLKVKFTHSSTVREKKPYTIYEIEARSSTMTWVVYKRYNDFYSLHQELGKNQTPNLPNLPAKRLTGLLSTEFVQKRRKELQDYLTDILQTPAILHSRPLLTFLEVPESIRPVSAPFDSETKDPNSDSKSDMKQASFQQCSPDERKVLELVHLLKVSPARVAAIKAFEDYFFEQRPRLSNEYIRILYQGKNAAQGEGGLIETSGDYNHSNVASHAALDLICRLVDLETNKDAQLFLDQFSSLDLSVLKRMQFQFHILHEHGNRLSAFRILSALRNNNTSNRADLSVEQLVIDKCSREEYFRWAERQTDQVVLHSPEPRAQF